jgi:hypothetical protein
MNAKLFIFLYGFRQQIPWVPMLQGFIVTALSNAVSIPAHERVESSAGWPGQKNFLTGLYRE